MNQQIEAEKKATLTQITTICNNGEQKSISQCTACRGGWATLHHNRFHSCQEEQERKTKVGTRKLDSWILPGLINFDYCNMQMVWLEFGINGRNPLTQPVGGGLIKDGWNVFLAYISPLIPIENNLNATVCAWLLTMGIPLWPQITHPVMTTSSRTKLVPWTWQWVQCTSIVSPVTRSKPSRAPLGCGGSGDLQHEWTIISKKCFRHLIKSLPWRNRTRENKGGPTKHWNDVPNEVVSKNTSSHQ